MSGSHGRLARQCTSEKPNDKDGYSKEDFHGST
jgi:hypothetical protein